MYRFTVPVVGLLTILLLPGIALAQDDAGPYIFATYWTCDGPGDADVDALVADSFGPALDATVAAGAIQNWGWLIHYMGGKWQRANYSVAPTLDALLAARDAFVAANQQDRADASAAFGSVCTGHDDYIWQFVTGSQPGEEMVENRPSAALSVYFVCDGARGARADAVVEQAFAPLFNEAVENGTIASWGWLSHVAGGSYTRLLVMDGSGHASNLNVINQLIGRMVTEESSAFSEFDDICHTHEDYLWNIWSAEE